MTTERLATSNAALAAAPAAGASFCPGCGAAQELARCTACGAARTAGLYRIVRTLHESDHARVYLAEDATSARVALKELIFARAPDAKTIDAFSREAEVLRQLDHPAIPRFVGAFREGDGPHTRLYLAQEYVEGKSLAKVLDDRRFDEASALQIARQVLQILRYLHSLSPPVVHRDVKPANLIVRPDGSVKLVDFGTAREVAPRGTHQATVAGTFGYMPPEALGGTVDRTADLYGLGATVLHLLSRRPPEELLFATDDRELERLINAAPATLAWLRKLTDASRARRFQSAAEALAALGDEPPRAAPAAPAEAPRAQEAPPAVDGSSRSIDKVGAAAVAAAVLIGIVGWIVSPPRSSAPPERRVAKQRLTSRVDADVEGIGRVTLMSSASLSELPAKGWRFQGHGIISKLSLSNDGGQLALDVSETNSIVSLNGELVGPAPQHLILKGLARIVLRLDTVQLELVVLPPEDKPR